MTIASIVAAGLVTWFIFSSTYSATRQPVIDVSDAYLVGGTLYITFRNLGGADVSISSVSGNCQSGGSFSWSSSTPLTLLKGGTNVVKATVTGNVNDGDLCTAQVVMGGNSLAISFRVVKP
ncbi:hypothetical protein [Infirmifilum uzonense]|uniref:hypothetical protein n=1 Tax=Infirmifilum uzonense TaxID=1550241 RepID=UPI00168D14DD|nr:hypothetical protein [Infirmifilum uzonense]